MTEDEIHKALADGRVTTVGAATVIDLAKLALYGSLPTTGLMTKYGIPETIAPGNQSSRNE